MKKFMSDKEIVIHLMTQHFKDDNTFSKRSKKYAILGIYTKKSKLKNSLYGSEYEDFGNIERKLFDEKTFYEFINKNKIVLQGIQGLSPIVSTR